MRITLGRPAAAIPDDDATRTVFAVRDLALEFGVIERVILGAHGEPLVGRQQAWAARDGPALQHAIQLEPQVVVQSARVVLVHDEQVAGAPLERAARLLGTREITLLIVGA